MFHVRVPKRRAVCCHHSFAVVNIGLTLFIVWTGIVLAAWGVRLASVPVSERTWDTNILSASAWEHLGVALTALIVTFVLRSHKLNLYIMTEKEYYRRVGPDDDDSELYSVVPVEKTDKPKPSKLEQRTQTTPTKAANTSAAKLEQELESAVETVDETSAESQLANSLQQQLETTDEQESKVQEAADIEIVQE